MNPLDDILESLRACRLCQGTFIHEPNPVVRLFSEAKVLIIGQAPGRRVHSTSVPWNDPSGDLLRQWLGVNRDFFYDSGQIAIMPMGFCYPGKGKSGDLPPSPKCAPTWHQVLLRHLPHVKLTLLVGSYAQAYYLKALRKPSLQQTVSTWQDYTPLGYFPMVHPSPRNRLWLRKKPWFEGDVIPHLRSLLFDIWDSLPPADDWNHGGVER
ncbi:MAG: uracil-DNA glycosylase family protein [Holosporales bacterium]